MDASHHEWLATIYVEPPSEKNFNGIFNMKRQ